MHRVAHINTGTSVASRFLPEDELEPAIRRDNPGLVELSRAEPTRGSVVSIDKSHRFVGRRVHKRGRESRAAARQTGRRDMLASNCERSQVRELENG
jgi:hypothetical protein